MSCGLEEYHVDAPEGMIAEVNRVFGKDGYHWSMLGHDGESKLRRLVEAAFPPPGHGAPQRLLNIIEIGSHRGVSACILADYGQVTTFDIDDEPLFDQVVHHFRKDTRIRRRLIPTTSDHRWERARQGDAHLSELLPAMKFDLAFVDGNHDLDSVQANYEAVKHCGCVIFHDYELTAHRDRTVEFVDNLRDGRTTKLSPFAMWEKFEL